jgi:rhodanese-related sulfurtransferase
VVQQIAVRRLAAHMANGHRVHLLDVRQPWEHAAAALPDSQLIPLNEIAARADEIRPPDGALLVVYCHHGLRSLSAAALLERLGFPNVVSLAGGLDAWSCEVDPGVPRY